MTLGRRARGTAAAFAALVACGAAVSSSCRSAAVRPAPAVAPPFAAFQVPGPVIRIGVATGVARASIGADSGLAVAAVSGAQRPGPALPRATFRAVRAESGWRVALLETGEAFDASLVAPFAPGDATFALEAGSYRGVLEVRADSAGGLTVVNVVNLEDYLRGVVPNELSPSVYPELEALKAQAVAARTYAVRNLGQFASQGYDLCATPACQVYRGRSSEHPLTDQAVADTAGQVALHGRQPINALYTSTCGGHTEDGVNIFEGEPQPYLRGVMCAPEKASWGSLRTSHPRDALGPEPGLNRDVALLVALGVIEPEAAQPRPLRELAPEDEIRSWTARLASVLRRKPCASGVEPPLARRASFFHHVVGYACWADRARRLLGPEEPDYLLQVEDRAGFSTGESRAAALLLAEGVLQPGPDNTLRPNAAISRTAAIQVLAGLARRMGGPPLRAASFLALDEGRLVVSREGAREVLELDGALALFRTLDGQAAAASEVALAPGDALQYVGRQDRVVFLEAEQPRSGLASDRSSRYYRWEVRLTPGEVEKSVARYGSVGSVRDVQVRRLGVSGRVVELAVLGDKGELSLRGLRIRWGLGLRENLFVVDREFSEDGTSLAWFVFTGKGWGHGVGLCQVGSFGMARSGASYEQILKHYYSGVRIGSPEPDGAGTPGLAGF